MLSRVRALRGLCVLRPFNAKKIEQHLSQELREELERLQELDDETHLRFAATYGQDPQE